MVKYFRSSFQNLYEIDPIKTQRCMRKRPGETFKNEFCIKMAFSTIADARHFKVGCSVQNIRSKLRE